MRAKNHKARDIEGLNLSRWRAALNGAEFVNPQTIERFVARFAPYGLRSEIVLPVYGLAEATLGVAAPPLGSGLKVDRIERNAFEREGRAVVVEASEAPADDPAGVLEFASVGKLLRERKSDCWTPSGETWKIGAKGIFGFAVRRARRVITGIRKRHRPFCAATAGSIRAIWRTRPRAILHHWTRQGHHHQGREKYLSARSGRNCGAREGRAHGLHSGFRPGGQKSGTERLIIAAELRDSSARDRVVADITEQVAAVIAMPPDSVEILRSRMRFLKRRAENCAAAKPRDFT